MMAGRTKNSFPYVMATDIQPQEYFLVAEKAIAGQIRKAEHLPGALIASYYVFNIVFPAHLKPFYLLLENCLIGRCSEKMSSSTKSVFTALYHTA
jgi:hypothetical protein